MRSNFTRLICVALAATLGACASQPPQPSAVEPVRRAPRLDFKVVEPQGPTLPPAAREAPHDASVLPLDASRLPPFDGERREVRETLRGLPKFDRTVQPGDL